jgi:CRP/FNR family transcriptional regulator
MLEQRKTAPGFSKPSFTGTLALLNGMSQQTRQRVNSMMRITKRQRGEWVFVLGDPAESIYFLQKGRMKITALSPDGHEVLHEIMGPGEIFGHTSSMLGIPRTTSAQTLEDSLLCEISRKDFESLLTLHPELSLQLLKSVGRRLKKAEAQLVNFICHDVSQRVRDALIELVDKESIVAPERAVEIRITQQDLANLVGASRQKTWQALKELEDSGVLKLMYRSIMVTAPHKLRNGSSARPALNPLRKAATAEA